MPIFALTEDLVFPPAHLASPEGLLAVGGDLSPERILLAYNHGIFPWYSPQDPILWWSPDPRMILFPQDFRVSRSLKKKIDKRKFEVSLDQSFEQVIHLCARTRTDNSQGTWITPEMMEAYNNLHRLGFGHSVEVWCQGKLAGGLYGLSIGRCFFGESMFSKERDASKLALYHLCLYLKARDFCMIDCQVPSAHLKSLGAVSIRRKEFLGLLRRGLKLPSHIGIWELN